MEINQDFSIACFICGKSIRENQNMHTLQACIERERDGAYDVDSSEGYMAVCDACGVKHEFKQLIHSEIIAIIETIAPVIKHVNQAA